MHRGQPDSKGHTAFDLATGTTTGADADEWPRGRAVGKQGRPAGAGERLRRRDGCELDLGRDYAARRVGRRAWNCTIKTVYAFFTSIYLTENILGRDI